MAKILLISPSLVREGSYIGDIVSIYDNNVELGPAYALFKIISIPEYTAEQVVGVFDQIKEEVRQAYRTSAPSDSWSFIEPERERVWKDDTVWKFAVKKPKYRMNLSITAQQISDLENPSTPPAQKLAILRLATDNIHRDAVNQTPVF